MAEFEHNSEKFGYINLDDIEGVQTALSKLGKDPGTIDGKDGPKTRHAVHEFQTEAQIKIDGIAGPETKGALRAKLDELSAAPAPAPA
ncbi:MAG TPA: peptidoglycan-binding domain-containing protein [Polyangiaceae bacterium]|nr:peptidoglycan-binding domain-containing protein [Polyangiaceae bacterium]